MSQELLAQALPLHQAGRLAEAENIYRQILAREPGAFPALHLMGLMRLQQARFAEAQRFMEEALRVKPGVPETLGNYAIVLSAQGRHEEALAVMDQACLARPADPAPFLNRGAIKSKRDRHEEALKDFDRGLALEPTHIDGLNNRGLTLHALGRYEEALASFDTLLRLKPDHAEARNNRGLTLRELGRNDEALGEFDQVIARHPGHAGAHVNRASILWRQEKLDEALESYNRALAINPALIPALESRANLLWTRRQNLTAAMADLEEIVRLAPDTPYAKGDLLQLKMHAGDWRDFAREKAALDQAVRAGKPAAEPFVYQGLCDNPADLLICARNYAARKFPPRPSAAPARGRRPGPLRIGYVCGEFRAQATMYLAAGLFERHDRSRFEIIAFDNGRDDGSAMRARVVASFDRFVPIANVSDRDAIAAIRRHEIDILVSLNGYFGRHRAQVFAARSAPIQVNYLGFPGTLGAPYMDYILADKLLIEEADHPFYAEKVVSLPGSYQINDSKRMTVAPSSRAQHGLPEDSFVFCHFNYGYKITPDLFAAWMRILNTVPGSLLWLLAGDPLFAKNLKAEAAAAGVDPHRLIFAPPLELEAHLARLPLGDLFLDTIISNAHTTASDALWAGLPLLTRRGTAFAGRVAASLLQAAGLPELVTHALQEYENLAIRLAREPARLKSFRQRLAEARFQAPLFDTAATTRHIEAAYEKMQALKENGEAPRSFAVSGS